MGVVSQVMGNFGDPHEIEHEGRVYKLSLIDQRVKSAFEKARFQKAKEALTLIKEELGAAEYARQLQEKTDLYVVGEYEIFSESGMAYIRTVAGMRLLLSLIIDCDQNTLMGLILAKKDEIVPLLTLILRESFPGLKIETVAPSASETPATAEQSQPAAEAPAVAASVPNG